MLGVYEGQHVVVHEPGLKAAPNLLARFSGSGDLLCAAKEGWWLGRVEAAVDHGGERKLPSYPDLIAEEAQGSRKAKKPRRGDRGDEAGVSSGGAAAESAGPRVHKVKVMWMGQQEGSAVSFSSAKPLVPLGIRDTVPRDSIIYEEPQPGRVSFKKNMTLTKATVTAISATVPRSLVTDPSSQGHKRDVEPAPSRTVVHNHAGVAIHPNVGPRGLAEEELWAAALQEVAGFEWSGPRSVEDPKPPSYRVANIRRDSRGTVYAVVTTSDGDVQYDHSLPSVRQRIHKARVACEVKSLPFMVQYRNLGRATLTLDWGVLRDNAVYYNQVLR